MKNGDTKKAAVVAPAKPAPAKCDKPVAPAKPEAKPAAQKK